MSEQRLEIEYRCMHPACIVNCRDGVIAIDEGFYKTLSEGMEEGVFKSPKGICRMGFTQNFKVVKKCLESDALAAPEELVQSPLDILMNEHKGILRLLFTIEAQLKKRDVEGLWLSTAQLENDLNLHSGQKEEEVLFPIVKDLLPMAEGLIAIVREDHREILSLMYSYRNALMDGDIIDGVIKSMIVSLKSHIRKEDHEFFELLKRVVTNDHKKAALEGMARVASEFIPVIPGNRKELAALNKPSSEYRSEMDEAISAARELIHQGCCH